MLCHNSDTVQALYFSKIFRPIDKRKLNYFVEFV